MLEEKKFVEAVMGACEYVSHRDATVEEKLESAEAALSTILTMAEIRLEEIEEEEEGIAKQFKN